MIQHIHRNRIDHRDFSVIILKYKYHVEILQMKLYSLKVYELGIFESDDKRRLKKKTIDVFCFVNLL